MILSLHFLALPQRPEKPLKPLPVRHGMVFTASSLRVHDFCRRTRGETALHSSQDGVSRRLTNLKSLYDKKTFVDSSQAVMES